MKFWKKIFLYSVILTMVLINGVGIIIIEKIHKNNLDRIILDTIDSQKNIISSIYLSYDTVGSLEVAGNEVRNWFEIILRNYIYTNIIDMKNIEIFNDENKLITSLRESNIENNINEVFDTNSTERSFIIRTINNEKSVAVSSQFKINNSNYKLVLSRNIDSVYKDKLTNYKVFLILDVIINILLIIGMYIISKHITKPIVELTKVSIDISNGEYNKRANYGKNKDEIGVLSANFNFMMQVLEEKIEELEGINKEKQRFINNLTHEIKTPVTSIIGYSDLLLNGNIDENIKFKALKYINLEGRRLENLSSALIKLTMIKNNNLEKSLIPIKECMSDAIQTLSYKLIDKKILLNINMVDKKILADKQLIVVLIINLLENSIKACNQNGNIIVTGELNHNSVYNLYIKDDGVGIGKEDLDKITEPFYMVDKARGRDKNGLGLGLAICKQICIIYNMDFEITSELNKGTVIKLSINIERD